jgi:hypothetical protein
MKKISNLFLATMVVMLAFGSLTATRAQDDLDRVELAVSPQVIEISANPGETKENQIRLDNLSEGTVQIEAINKNFTARGEEGAVDLTEDDTTYSLAKWMTVTPSTVTMPAKTSQDFSVVIDIPEDAEPGGHFGSVVFKTVPPENEDGAATVSQEIAPIFLVSVAGDVIEKAEIASFNSTKSFWSNERPIQLETRIKNDGTVHFKPSGTITIKNMFGSEVATIKLEEKNVLPDSIRRIVSDWDPGFSVGRYSADLTVVYGEDKQILNSTTTFIVFPYQTILPIAIVTFGLLFVVIKFRKRIGAAMRVLSGKS